MTEEILRVSACARRISIWRAVSWWEIRRELEEAARGRVRILYVFKPGGWGEPQFDVDVAGPRIAVEELAAMLDSEKGVDVW
eukprot:g8726.t1